MCKACTVNQEAAIGIPVTLHRTSDFLTENIGECVLAERSD